MIRRREQRKGATEKEWQLAGHLAHKMNETGAEDLSDKVITESLKGTVSAKSNIEHAKRYRDNGLLVVTPATFTVEMTEKQRACIEWALGAMDGMSDQDYEALGYTQETALVADANSRKVVLPDDEGFLDDLRYRITDQLVAMTYEAPEVEHPTNVVRAFYNAWDRITEAHTPPNH